MTLYKLPQCYTCKHKKRGLYCTAFVKGIPGKILNNEHDHRKPYKGDNGIRFEPIKKESN